MRLAFALVAIALAGCKSTPEQTTAQSCDGYDRGRLAGLRAGARITPPDPATEHGKKTLEEIAFLEMKCDLEPE
jgi:hypothetical protein